MVDEVICRNLLCLPDPLSSGINIALEVHKLFVERLRSRLYEIELLIAIQSDYIVLLYVSLFLEELELLALPLVG